MQDTEVHSPWDLSSLNIVILQASPSTQSNTLPLKNIEQNFCKTSFGHDRNHPPTATYTHACESLEPCNKLTKPCRGPELKNRNVHSLGGPDLYNTNGQSELFNCPHSMYKCSPPEDGPIEFLGQGHLKGCFHHLHT